MNVVLKIIDFAIQKDPTVQHTSLAFY